MRFDSLWKPTAMAIPSVDIKSQTATKIAGMVHVCVRLISMLRPHVPLTMACNRFANEQTRFPFLKILCVLIFFFFFIFRLVAVRHYSRDDSKSHACVRICTYMQFGISVIVVLFVVFIYCELHLKILPRKSMTEK